MKKYFYFLFILVFASAFAWKASYGQPTANRTKKLVVSPTLDRNQTGLRIYKPEKSYAGYTLFAHGPLLKYGIANLYPIYLVDMQGNIVYQWVVNTSPILVKLEPNGHLFYIDDQRLRELDMQSNVLWEYTTCSISHAFNLISNGNFIIDRDEYFEECAGNCFVKNNRPSDRTRIEIITPDKKVIWSWKAEEHQEQILKLTNIRLHPDGSNNNNSCEILKNTPLSKKDPRFSQGNILFSYSYASIIGIIEYPSGKVVWAWGSDILDGQHSPTMLDNGNLLIFDNGENRGWSRVIEINPLTKEIVWEYRSEPKEDFYSTIYGNAHRLPNGNTLICEGWRNRIFEVTYAGEIVWDFISVFNRLNGTGNIYQAHRYSPEYVRPLLEARKKMLKL